MSTRFTFTKEIWHGPHCAGDVEITVRCQGPGDAITILEATVERTGRPFPIRLLEGMDFSEDVQEAASAEKEYFAELGVGR